MNAMQLLRAKKFWNVCALLALALWYAPGLAWTCPRMGGIADSPEGAMRLAAGGNPAAQSPAPVQCAACPREHAASSAAVPRSKSIPATQCCLAAWMPDTSRVAQRAAAAQAPAMLVQAFELAEPETVAASYTQPCASILRSVARAGPRAPRGPPAVWS